MGAPAVDDDGPRVRVSPDERWSALSRRDDLLAAVADVTGRLLRSASWRDEVPDTLELLGRAAVADRSFLYECDTEPDGTVVSRMTAEWAAEGIAPTIGTALWQTYREQPEDVARLTGGEPILYQTSAAGPEKRAVLDAEGTRGTLIVPIIVEGRLWGLIGFDDCHVERSWAPFETETLRTAAGALGAAIERASSVDELRRLEAILGAVATASERLLQAERWEEAIADVIALLGRATGSSRAYMFETAETATGGLISSMRHEWTAEGIQPTITWPRWQGYEEHGWHAERLRAGEPSALRAADDELDELEALQVEGTLVYVSVPIRARGRLWGYLGFDDCVAERLWSPLELEALRAAAGTIGAAMERELSDARLDAREGILEAVAAGAERLLRARSWRDAIDDVLELLGRAGAASRCWMFECEETDTRVTSTLTHEWVAPGVQRSRVSEFWQERIEPPQSVAAFLRGEPLQRLREELPPEARAKLAAEGTLSIICVPILIEGRLAGYIGYDDCATPRRWSPSEQEALRTASSVLGSALQREESLEAVRRRERVLAAVATAAQQALTAPTVEEAVAAVLAELGVATEASRVFVVRYERPEDGGVTVADASEWVAPGFVASDRSVWDGWVIPADRIAAYERGESVQGLTRDFDGPFRERLEATATRSFLLVPVTVRGRVWGAIGFNDYLGERTWQQPEIEALRAAAGTLGGVIERELSLEALRESDERLWQAHKMEAIGRLAAGLAHDLRNYLTVIVSYATFLREQLPGDARADADALLETAGRVGDLVDRLLAFGRPQDKVTPEVLDVGEVLLGIKDVLRALLPESQSLSVSVASGLDPVLMDRAQLERAIVNLALNARDAMPGAGTLAVVARSDRAGVALDVADTGVGMDEATQARVFEPFFTTKTAQGTGLGLPIVYGIVTRNGGTVDIASTPGAGTCVTLRLPRAGTGPAAA